MSTPGPIDVERIMAAEGDWIVAALEDEQVALNWHDDARRGGVAVRFNLTPDEAHELGTKLRLMAGKARA